MKVDRSTDYHLRKDLLRYGYLLKKCRGKGYFILEGMAFFDDKEIVLAGKDGNLSVEEVETFLKDIAQGIRPI